MTDWLKVATICNIGQFISIPLNLVEPYLGVKIALVLFIPLLFACWRELKN